MFELKIDNKGEKVLVFTKRPRSPQERGLWVEVAHEKERYASRYVELNRMAGLQVEKDEHGFFRALVLSD